MGRADQSPCLEEDDLTELGWEGKEIGRGVLTTRLSARSVSVMWSMDEVSFFREAGEDMLAWSQSYCEQSFDRRWWMVSTAYP